MKQVDILFKNCTIVSIDNNMNIFENGNLAVKGNKIFDIWTDNENKFYEADTVFENKILIPGLINAHTHVAMAYFKGIADDIELFTWLNNYIWPLEAKFLSNDFVLDSSLHGCAEMIKNGITLFSDMYFFEQATAKAAEKAGIRAILGEGVLDFPAGPHKNSDEMIYYAVKANKKWADSELIDFQTAPHAVYTCGPEALKNAFRAAKENDMLMHIHISETQKENADCIEKFGCTPVQHLEKLGVLDKNVILAHSVWTTEKDREIIANRKCGIAINTESNLKLASGFAPLKEYREKGIKFAFGTDGVASNNNLSILEEMSTTAKLHKALNADPTFLPAKDVLKAATYDAACIMGKENEIGSLEIGKKADIVCFDMNTLEAQPCYNVYSHIIYTLQSENIKDVVINGKVVMKNRILTTLNEEEILNNAVKYKKIISGEIS